MSMNKRMNDLLFWFSRGTGYPFAVPEVIQIPMTQACNLECSMCSIHGSPSAVLSLDTITGILDQAAEMGIKEAVLTGGEPFLRKDVFEIGNHCRAKGLRAIVTTNGTLIDARLAASIVGSGLGHIHFSLDGMEKTNDLVRGAGNFEKAVRGIKILDSLRKEQKRDLSIGIACTVMDHNLEDLPRLVEYADGLGVDVINFQPLLRDNSNTPDRGETKFWVTEKRWPALEEAVKKIEGLARKHIQVYEEPPLRLLVKYYRRDLDRHDWKCFGGYKTLFVCVGDRGEPLVYTCHGVCGDLTQKSLRDCWRSPEAQKLRRSVRKCKALCLQSCYSRRDSESLMAVCRRFFDRI